jgi:hypothetical protein
MNWSEKLGFSTTNSGVLHITIYATALFFALSPRLFFTAYKKGSKLENTLAHTAIFAIALYFSSILMKGSTAIYEGIETSGNVSYTPDPNSTTNPSGPPYAESCNNMTLGQLNNQGQICQQKGENFLWVIPCNSSNAKFGVKNLQGQTCMDQGNNLYNWT